MTRTPPWIFYRDILGFEVRLDVGRDKMRWITVGPPNQPDTSVVLYPPAATPGLTDDGAASSPDDGKGTYGTLVRGSRLRPPRSCRQHDPHPGAALTGRRHRAAEASADGQVRPDLVGAWPTSMR